jgi:hypothetical protein
MEIYYPLNKNVGRWLQTRSFTHRGLIVKVGRYENSIFINFIDLIDKEPKIDSYSISAKATKDDRFLEYNPTKQESRKAIKFIFKVDLIWK